MAPSKEFTISEVYTFDMPKYVYVQVKGVEKPAKVQADKVEMEKVASNTSGDYKFVVKLGDALVGEFKGHSVDGWRIQNE